MAAGIINFSYLPGMINPADILSKIWGYQQVKERLKALLFWEGDTLLYDDSLKGNGNSYMKHDLGD